MRKLLIISTIVLGAFATTGVASAADITVGSYAGWADDAFEMGR